MTSNGSILTISYEPFAITYQSGDCANAAMTALLTLGCSSSVEGEYMYLGRGLKVTSGFAQLFNFRTHDEPTSMELAEKRTNFNIGERRLLAQVKHLVTYLPFRCAPQ
jgi:hypothetical protein